MLIKRGSSRIVFIFSNIVFKLPRCGSYIRFLYGLINNMTEILFYKTFKCKTKKLCPILFSFPFGLAIIMKKADPITKLEYVNIDFKKFIQEDGWIIPMENKKSSFGKINKKIVAVDYGG